MPRLDFEDEIFGTQSTPIAGDLEIYETARHSRQTLNSLFESYPDDDKCSVVEKKYMVAEQGDRGATVDDAIVQALQADGGANFLLDRVLKLIPSATRLVEVAHVLEQVKARSTKHLYKSCSRDAQGMVSATIDALVGMASGRCPLRKAFEGGMMALIFSTFEYFCKRKVNNKGATGTKALEAAYDATAKGQTPTLQVLEIFHTFSWLMDKNMATDIEDKTREVVAGVQYSRKRDEAAAKGSAAQKTEARGRLGHELVQHDLSAARFGLRDARQLWRPAYGRWSPHHIRGGRRFHIPG